MSISISDIETLIWSNEDTEVIVSTTNGPFTDHQIELTFVGYVDGAPPDEFIVTAPVIDGAATFEIKDFLKERIEDEHLYGEILTVRINKTNLSRRYYIKYREVYEGGSSSYFQTTDRWALQGGINQGYRKYLSSLSRTLYEHHIVQNKRFLTWQGTNKYISKEAKERLYFLHVADEDLTLKCKFYFDDLSEQTIDLAGKSFEEFEVYEMLVGYKENSFETYEIGKLIVKYDVWLEGLGGPRSETKTFIIDNVTYHFRREYIILNSLGAYDFLEFRGVTQEDQEASRELIQNQERQKQITTQIIELYTANTGWINKIWKNPRDGRQYITEILISQDLYEITGQFAQKLLIITTSVFKHLDNVYLYQFQFQYAFSDVYQNFSPNSEYIDLENEYDFANYIAERISVGCDDVHGQTRYVGFHDGFLTGKSISNSGTAIVAISGDGAYIQCGSTGTVSYVELGSNLIMSCEEYTTKSNARLVYYTDGTLFPNGKTYDWVYVVNLIGITRADSENSLKHRKGADKIIDNATADEMWISKDYLKQSILTE